MTITETEGAVGAERRTQPESFRGRELTASLTVNDLQKSLEWYHGVVGFHIDRRHEREGRLVAVSLKAGTVRILLNQDDGAKGQRVKGQGMSMMITTAQDVDELAARVKERGAPLLTEPADMPWGARMFRLQDPDGFTWVIATES
jgi:lactoylglutathione lyase